MRVISSVSLWKKQKVLFDSGSPHAITWGGSLQWAIFLQTDLRKNYSAEVPFRYIETFADFTCFLKAKQACAVILKSSGILIRASLEMSDSGSWGLPLEGYLLCPDLALADRGWTAVAGIPHRGCAYCAEGSNSSAVWWTQRISWCFGAAQEQMKQRAVLWCRSPMACGRTAVNVASTPLWQELDSPGTRPWDCRPWAITHPFFCASRSEPGQGFAFVFRMKAGLGFESFKAIFCGLLPHLEHQGEDHIRTKMLLDIYFKVLPRAYTQDTQYQQCYHFCAYSSCSQSVWALVASGYQSAVEQKGGIQILSGFQ